MSFENLPICDLHFHSMYSSDAFNVPEVIVANMASAGCEAFSITDHDNLTGIPIFEKLAKKYGMRFIPGIELTSHDSEYDLLDILGYGIDVNAPEIIAQCENEQSIKRRTYDVLVSEMTSAGYITDIDEYNKFVFGSEPNRVVGLKHARLWLIHKGIASRMREAFPLTKNLIHNKWPDGRRATTEETIQTIHAAGGVAVIAHPTCNILDHRNPLPTKRWQSMCDKILSFGADGIEAHTPSNGSVSLQNEVAKYAASKNVLITGGSDFHGSIDDNDKYVWKSEAPISVFYNLENLLKRREITV